jgi:hypothetical protein
MAGATATAPPAGAEDQARQRRIDELKRTAEQLDALLKDELAHDVDPVSLFQRGLALDDQTQIELERRRLATLLQGAAPAATAAASASAAPTAPSATAPSEAGAGGADAGTDADDPLWLATLEVDRKRHAFLSLSSEQREKLLASHAARRDAAKAEQPKEQGAEARARAASEERRQLLEEAKKQRSAALRLVTEERARLLGVKEQQADYEAKLARLERQTAERVEDTLVWTDRVRKLVERHDLAEATGEDADMLAGVLQPELTKAPRPCAVRAMRAGTCPPRAPAGWARSSPATSARPSTSCTAS